MQQVDQVKERHVQRNMGEMNFSQADDILVETTRARFTNLLKRHGELLVRLSRDSDKSVFERLQREFEAAHASRTQEIHLEGEQWNDGLFATIRERVHLKAERKLLQLEGESTAMANFPFYEKITYRNENKMICCLDGARIGIQYEITLDGEPCGLFHCVLESKSFLEKMTVCEHTAPLFLPIHEVEKDYLSTNATKFIDHVGHLLQAYVDRREQVRIMKELHRNRIGELYCTQSYHMIEFVFAGFDCKVVASLRYADLVSTLPSEVDVLAWPMQLSTKARTSVATSTRRKAPGHRHKPARLTHAEDLLQAVSLPEAFAEIVLTLSQALNKLFPDQNV